MSAAQQVRMWSPKGDCHIALTSGHTIIIPGDESGTDMAKVPAGLRPKFRKEALARGCLPVGMQPEPEEEGNTFDRDGTIKAKMSDGLKENK